jgi:AraC-like DNA-binding protein
MWQLAPVDPKFDQVAAGSHLVDDKDNHMRTESPALAPIFRSHLQGRLLAAVLLGTYAVTIAALAQRVQAPESTVHREVERLVRTGVLTSRRAGRARLIEPNDDTPATRPLRDLVMIAYGPQYVLGQQLADVDGISKAFLYGSWAARFHGEPGALPNDIDVLIVGSPDRDDVHDRLLDASRLLQREVNPTFVSVDRWSDPSADPFLATVVSRPMVSIATPDYTPRGSAA